MDFKTWCTPHIQLQRHGRFMEIMIGHLMHLDLDIIYADPEFFFPFELLMCLPMFVMSILKIVVNFGAVIMFVEIDKNYGI